MRWKTTRPFPDTKVLLTPSPPGNSHLPIPRDLSGGHSGSIRTRGRGRHGARPRAEVVTPAPGAPPALPCRAPTSSAQRTLLPSRATAGCGRCPGPSYLLARTPGDVCRAAPRAGSLPACVRPGPLGPTDGFSGSPAGARGQRSPRGCRPPLPSPSTPACRRTLDFPVYSNGVTAPGGGGFPSPHLPAADARVIIARLNKAATQVRGSCGQPAQARAIRCRTASPAVGGQGKGEGKADKAWSRG